jgi:serine/threonine protein kinase
MHRFAPGDRVGNYRIEAELGASGAGVRYAAVHLVLPRRAVVRVMHVTNQALAVVLLREACILEALSDPGVPRVYDSGLLPDRRPWFAIEQLADPVTLADTPPMPLVEALEVVRDLAAILEHAHRRGVIVRGLRPDRIAIMPRVCIVDWSDARTHDAGTRIPSLPAPGARAYLAPEQLRGEADDRADIFALGTIACAMIAERHDGLGALFEQMVAADRYDRPSAAEVHARIVELIASAATLAIPRIRKPRWTPAYGAAAVPPDASETAASSSRST